MNSQINASFSFKRFATASASEIVKICEDRHEETTKRATKWAVNVFQGKDFLGVKISLGLTFTARISYR